MPHGRTFTVDAADGVLANDHEDAGDSPTASLVAGVSNGTLALHPDGSFSYSPNAGFVGTDQFTYRVHDSLSESDDATVTLTVFDNAPVASEDSYSILHDHSLVVAASSGVLANDVDDAGETLSVSVVAGQSTHHGTLSLLPDGSFTYVPTAGFVGSDQFTYVASDGLYASDPTVVEIDVTNARPIAVADTYFVAKNTTASFSVTLGVLANDSDDVGDTLAAVRPVSTSHGSLSLSGNGSFTYAPSTGFVGTDSFVYQASDGLLYSANTVVTLIVTDQAVAGLSDSYSIGHDQVLTATASVLANDWSRDSHELSATLAASPAHGTLVLGTDGKFLYTPAAGYVGSDSFQYRAVAGGVQSSEIPVTLNVTNHAAEMSRSTTTTRCSSFRRGLPSAWMPRRECSPTIPTATRATP